MLLIQAGYLCKWTNDSQHLLLDNFDAICNSPSHLYNCGLPLSPPSSWLHKYYSAEFSQEFKVVKGLEARWGNCSRTVTLDSKPLALAYWRDTVAAGLQSSDIIILDVVTGSQVAVLSGHDDQVNSLTFSSGGTSIVSGSDDKTLKLWDVQTGGVVKTFCGHTDGVHSISISSECTIIASGSNDKTICLWDVQTGECHRVIRQQEAVYSVSFSPTDPQHLISVSGGVVQQWDLDGNQIKHTHRGSSAAFSLDGTHIISSEHDVATVWNSGSGVIAATCSKPTGFLSRWCFSPNGRLVAATAADTNAYIWDIANSDPHPIQTCSGHTNGITSLKFLSSSSLVSASSDRTVKFWQISVSTADSVASDPKPIPPARSITLQGQDGIAISSDSYGVVRTWDLSTGHCKASFQTLAGDSGWRDVRLVDSRLIVAWYTDEKIYIQDAEEDQLQTVDAPVPGIYDLRISEDGSKIYCLSSGNIQAWSVQTGEVVGKVDYNPEGGQLTVYGSGVWVSTAEGWDFGDSSSPPILLSGVLPDGPRLYFIGGVRKYRRILPGIEDTVTGMRVFQPPTRLVTITDAQWDGRYLVAGYENGDMLILDFDNMSL